MVGKVVLPGKAQKVNDKVLSGYIPVDPTDVLVRINALRKEMVWMWLFPIRWHLLRGFTGSSDDQLHAPATCEWFVSSVRSNFVIRERLRIY